VFRDATERTTLLALARAAERAVAAWRSRPHARAAAFDALLALGDYENALADWGEQPDVLGLVAKKADVVADIVVAGMDAADARELPRELKLPFDGGLGLGNMPAGAWAERPAVRKRAEGFAYYALRPRAVVHGLPAAADADRMVVVGIRTIGTTLSALAAAGLRRRVSDRVPVVRFTVRPSGHPYDRQVVASTATERAAEATVRLTLGPRTQFIIIDEGPGLSGSSFLAVATWLENLGASAEQIVLYGSHVPAPGTLCAPDADHRWRRYRNRAFEETPPEGTELAGGHWRSVMGLPVATWPPAASLTDREKRLQRAADGSLVVAKFEGLGAYGRACVRRLESVATAGFGPPVLVLDEERGSVATPLLSGARPSRDSFRLWAPQLVAYCAFRARDQAFAAANELAEGLSLVEAAIQNAQQELGGAPDPRGFRVRRPLVTDGRMQPWEWVATPDGRLLKTDASCHGDDHLLPGPTDIAWDLAGVVVEWELDEKERGDFLEAYRVASGDADLERVGYYEVAYAAFRAAACGMTRTSAGDEDERSRALAERERLRRRGRLSLARLR